MALLTPFALRSMFDLGDQLVLARFGLALQQGHNLVVVLVKLNLDLRLGLPFNLELLAHILTLTGVLIKITHIAEQRGERDL